MSIDSKAMSNIASLARIRLNDQENASYQKEIIDILKWVDQLNATNIEGVNPSSHAIATGLRRAEDLVSDGGYSEQILANSPERLDGFFAVPKVIE